MDVAGILPPQVWAFLSNSCPNQINFFNLDLDKIRFYMASNPLIYNELFSCIPLVENMCKAVDRGMVIQGVRLLEKRGGKSGDWKASD